MLRDPYAMAQNNNSEAARPSPELLKKKAYAESLNEQLRLKEERKRREKQTQLMEDQRIRQEQQEYQYFGKGGGGSARRDEYGRIIVSKKPDINAAANLYGRESYNRRLKGVVPSAESAFRRDCSLPVQEYVPPVQPVQYQDQAEVIGGVELERQIRLREEAEAARQMAEKRQVELERQIQEQQRLREQEELDRQMREEQRRQNLKEEKLLKEQLELEKKLREEQKKREEMQHRLNEEKMENEREELHIKHLKEQYELQKLKRKQIQTLSHTPASCMANIKLQADLEPEKTYRGINEREFVRKLPSEVKSYIESMVSSEIAKLSTELRYEEEHLLNSIDSLKVFAFPLPIERD